MSLSFQSPVNIACMGRSLLELMSFIIDYLCEHILTSTRSVM